MVDAVAHGQRYGNHEGARPASVHGIPDSGGNLAERYPWPVGNGGNVADYPHQITNLLLECDWPIANAAA